MPTTRKANRVTKDDHAATLTRRGDNATYDCDCGQSFTGREGDAEARWTIHVTKARAS
jgi:hypothetical protein